jgi:hypothetical protein
MIFLANILTTDILNAVDILTPLYGTESKPIQNGSVEVIEKMRCVVLMTQ